ncbi:hypothetical protein BGAL_0176g00210 [Botrytis galanthina]|uniref:Uncharacterized protein n=1 Tax=Botrytis galanthina TaxID=278940 RepID=A0A4S8R059_9HELO|nr:hypothetical protein BGAL_0176g00210 [Botrytis galanthina]
MNYENTVDALEILSESRERRESRRYREKGTGRGSTRRVGEAEKQRSRDAEMQRCRDAEMQRCRDADESPEKV